MLTRVAGVALVLGAVWAGGIAVAQSRDQMSTLEARGLGMTLFADHCSACHGRSGHGDGPRAREFDVRPPDLTRLSERNQWGFPAERVAQVIDGADRAHRAGDMPLWGDVFRAGDPSRRTEAQVRVDALVRYLEFIQTRRPK